MLKKMVPVQPSETLQQNVADVKNSMMINDDMVVEVD